MTLCTLQLVRGRRLKPSCYRLFWLVVAVLVATGIVAAEIVAIWGQLGLAAVLAFFGIVLSVFNLLMWRE